MTQFTKLEDVSKQQFTGILKREASGMDVSRFILIAGDGSEGDIDIDSVLMAVVNKPVTITVEVFKLVLYTPGQRD